MACSLITLALFLFVKRVLAENVMLGESVKFTVTAQCAEELRTRDSSRTVAALVDGVWTPGDFYKDRIKHLSPSAVILTGVNYNDDGLFEFFCGGRVVTRVHLRVVAPWKISAPRGGAVVVPCHSFTAGGHVKSSKWEKDGEVVMELHPPAGSVTISAGLKDRVSVPSDWNLTGDWSLTLKEVQTEDRGVYICHARDRNGKESLVAVRLTVDEGPLDQISATSPPASPPPCTTETWTAVLSAAVVLLIPAAFGCGWWLKSRRPNVPPEEGVLMTHRGDRGPAGPQVNEVQANGY